MPRVDDGIRAPDGYAHDASASQRRSEDPELTRERRRGPSRLSTWSGLRVLRTGFAWVGLVLGLVLIAAGVSVARDGTSADVRLAVTRSNLIGLAASLLCPPLCLTAQWWRMRNRRHTRRSPQGESSDRR